MRESLKRLSASRTFGGMTFICLALVLWGDRILPQRLMLAVSIVALPILFLASAVSISALMKTIRGTRE